jgi:hypothetical protein
MIRSVAIICALVFAAPLAAEDLVVREILQEKPLSGSDTQVVIVSKLTLKPGGRIP